MDYLFGKFHFKFTTFTPNLPNAPPFRSALHNELANLPTPHLRFSDKTPIYVRSVSKGIEPIF